ncbi:6-carboxytetrahydropterin synthase [Burkholderia sp. GbtcB21]|uniref:6-pyruvoyl trahydropterin synthase family protein n=1 Tax=Burkholderia sp. GbtcB21 TaxID=2824766 RepID=UPI001C30B574|nr:6-carboxytetrahydropterin synthase [Burkholderia sp. GbtcB21]
MNFELSQEFFFESAHTLHRDIEAISSRRIHGHTYHAVVFVEGNKDDTTGMVVDLGVLKGAINKVRGELDHRFLDEVPDLGSPTLENLCAFLWRRFEIDFPTLKKITVRRKASGDACSVTK